LRKKYAKVPTVEIMDLAPGFAIPEKSQAIFFHN